MYGFVENHVAPDVRNEFPDEAKQKFKELRIALRKEPYAVGDNRKPLKDGSCEVSFRVGLRKVVIGFEVDEKQQLIFLNWVKWDQYWEALDRIAEFLGGEPVKKK